MSGTRAPAELSAKSSTVLPRGVASLHCEFRKRHSAANQRFALDVSLEATPGFTILFGASGAGKTTLLDCVAGVAKPESGHISVGGRILLDCSHNIDVPMAKRRVGYVFQTLALFPHMSVKQNVGYGLAHLSDAERKERVSEALQAFRIQHLAERSAPEISGGESQRAALARTLVTDPQVLLLDEPLAALDGPTKAHIIEDLRAWNRSHQIPIVYVTHSREEVFALGDRVIVLEAGSVVALGTPHEVMTAPRQETVAQLAGFENIFDAVVHEVHPERGTMVCRLVIKPALSSGTAALVLLETPLVRAGAGSELRIGIRSGDILLATVPPKGLSARNVIHGVLSSLEQRDVIVVAKVACGVDMEVHLTLAARDSLQLVHGKEVWLVIKTHSCHLMQK